MRCVVEVFLTFLVVACPRARSYKTGATVDACSNMVPGHQGAVPQTGPAPYTVTVETSTLAAGTRTTVTLGGGTFKGFLVQARAVDTDKAIGTFFTADQKVVNCSGQVANAVTHTINADKTTVQLTWEAPSDFIGNVVFQATFVKEFTTLWVGVKSRVVMVTKAGQNIMPTTAHDTHTPNDGHDHGSHAHDTHTHTDVPVRKALDKLYEGCNETKGCFGFPAGCDVTQQCGMMVTYSVDEMGHVFELFGSNAGFVATALSIDARMGADSVMACTNLDGAMEVVMAYNEGRNNEILNKRQLGLSHIDTLNVDGQLYCRFHREEQTNVKNTLYDMKNNQYHLLLSKGFYKKDALQYHGSDKIATSKLMDLNLYNTVSSATLHSTSFCMMVVAALVTVCSGIVAIA